MTIKAKLDLAFVLILLTVLGGFFVTYISGERMREQYELSDHSQKIVMHLGEVLNLILDVESGQRGFVLTGKDEYLRSFTEGKRQLMPALDSAAILVSDTPGQAQNLDVLTGLIERRIVVGETAIALRIQGDADAAVDLIRSGLGKALTDSIKLVHAVMEEAAFMGINQKSVNKFDQVFQNTRNLALLAFLIVVSLVLGYVVLRRNAKALLNYQKEQKTLINELNTRNRQLDDFAHIISHNLRSSSSNISALIGLLDEQSSREEYVEILGRLKSVSDNLTETLHDLIETLHVKSDGAIERQLLSFEEVSGKVIESLSAEVLRSGAEIMMNFTDAPDVEYPKVYLESILHNLVSNALKYADPARKPLIRLRSSRVNNRTVLLVSDNGLGIDLKLHRDKLFGYKKTFHSHPDAKGLGLFMVKTQLESLGGSIHAESEPGRGTSFIITF
jgi:CHASE3 domain sensor protein/two-component sensor histidine kinase